MGDQARHMTWEGQRRPCSCYNGTTKKKLPKPISVHVLHVIQSEARIRYEFHFPAESKRWRVQWRMRWGCMIMRCSPPLPSSSQIRVRPRRHTPLPFHSFIFAVLSVQQPCLVAPSLLQGWAKFHTSARTQLPENSEIYSDIINRR
jgi:hypothetical protein